MIYNIRIKIIIKNKYTNAMCKNVISSFFTIILYFFFKFLKQKVEILQQTKYKKNPQ